MLGCTLHPAYVNYIILYCVNYTILNPQHGPDRKKRRKTLYSVWPETRTIIATASNPSFSICHYEGPSKPGGPESKWDTSASGIRWWEIHREQIYILNRKTQKLLLVTSEVTAPEANAGKTKCMFMSREENARQNHTINTGKKNLWKCHSSGNNSEETKLHSWWN